MTPAPDGAGGVTKGRFGVQIFRGLITPNLGVRVLAGNCLAMAQGITGAPVRYASATEAAEATRLKHWDRAIPASAPAVLWFDHWGSYGSPGSEVYKNWGHVAVWVPGRGFASSSPVPGEVAAPYLYGSIEEVERVFASRFRFWSEDINGKRVCEKELEVDAKDIQAIANAVLDTPIDMGGSKKGGRTSVRTQMAMMDHQWAAVKRPVERFEAQHRETLTRLDRLEKFVDSTGKRVIDTIGLGFNKVTAAIQAIGKK